MILADKIIMERKKNGWSQEELADKLGVSRQAVSKWEGAQATPDIQRLLDMSKLFGVSVDYLLKEEIETEDFPIDVVEQEEGKHKVSMEMANAFLHIKEVTAPKIANATALCILSPAVMVFLFGLVECNITSITETFAGAIGMLVLLGMVAIACAIFIGCGMKTKDYEFLEKELIETEYGVTGMVKERKRRYEETYTRYNILGVVLCIVGVMALFVCAFFESNEMFAVVGFCCLLVLVAAGVRFFIIGGINQASFEKLLQEGDYTVKKKKEAKNPVVAAVTVIYWLVTTAIFLVLTFNSKYYNTSALIWPVAGVLFPAVLMLVKLFDKGNRE